MEMPTICTDELTPQAKVEVARKLDGWRDAPLKERLQHSAKQAMEQATESAKRAACRAERLVRRQPIAALIAAASLGGLAGLLLRRR